MTLPVLPFLIPAANFQGEPAAPDVSDGSMVTFGSLLSSALQAPATPATAVPPNAGLSATSLASVPIVAAAVSLGPVSGDPVAVVSEEPAADLRQPGESETRVETSDVNTPLGIEVTVPVAGVDGSSTVAFVPMIPGSTGPASETNHVPAAPHVVARPALQRVFADRLDRVIERMETEFGYRVEVVETVRTQSRQDALYAQGRERPGPIVTWTRNSRHTEGVAADVIIDGSYGNAAAYRQLAQLARDEGLRTLGPRDPGHVELPRTTPLIETASKPEASPAIMEAGPLPGVTREPERAARLRDMVASYRSETSKFQVPRSAAPVALGGSPPVGIDVPLAAAPARVERVAVVASVAMVAPVVAPVRGRSTPSADAPDAVRERSAARRIVDNPLPVGGGDVPPHAVLSDSDSAHRPVEPTLAAEPVERDQQPIPERLDFIETTDFGAQHGRHPETAAHAVSEARPSAERAVGPILSERIAELLNLRDAAAERPLSSVLLRLDSPDGTEDRIRIGLRGSSLDAAFEMSDRALVDDLNRHVAELARAVERQGLDPEHLVARASGTKDTIFGPAMAGEREGLRAAGTGNTNSGAPGHRDGRNSRHDASPEHPPRQRARRDSHGDR